KSHLAEPIRTGLSYSIPHGWPSNRKSAHALTETGHKDLQTAMDWLLSHPADEGPSPAANASGEILVDHPEGEVTEATAQSLKCNECQKLFKSVEYAEAHASRTGHTDFAESTEAIKPLTEEEKVQKLTELKERMAQKKQERLAREAVETREREKARREMGKNVSQTREQLEDQQILRAVEEKKREKQEERLARLRIKKKIEQDKLERAAKRAAEQAARSGQPPAASESPNKKVLSASEVAQTATVATSGYEQARIQIRPTSGPAFTHTFGADDKFQTVLDYVREQLQTDSFQLQRTFPREPLDGSKAGMTLRELKLVPSAALALIG
ncbi:hypothetical protein IWQ60_010472, partial [Tieghemiomyces parasiticus]